MWITGSRLQRAVELRIEVPLLTREIVHQNPMGSSSRSCLIRSVAIGKSAVVKGLKRVAVYAS